MVEESQDELPISYTVSTKGDRLVITASAFPFIDITFKGKGKEGNPYEIRIATDGEKKVTVDSKGSEADGKTLLTSLVYNEKTLTQVFAESKTADGEILNRFSLIDPLSNYHEVSFGMRSEKSPLDILHKMEEETKISEKHSKITTSEKDYSKRLQKFSKAPEYFPAFLSIMGEGNLISNENLTNNFSGGNLTGAKIILNNLSKAVPEAIEKTTNGYRVLDPDIFFQVEKAVGYVKPKKETAETISTFGKFRLDELEQFSFSTEASITHFPILRNLISPENQIIRGSDLCDNFEHKELIGVKVFLSHLTGLETKPIEKTNGDYKVNDSDVFSKIERVIEIKELFGSFKAAKYVKEMEKANLISQDKNRTTRAEIFNLFKRKDERIGIANSLKGLERKGKVKIIPAKRKQNRQYIFEPELLNP